MSYCCLCWRCRYAVAVPHHRMPKASSPRGRVVDCANLKCRLEVIWARVFAVTNLLGNQCCSCARGLRLHDFTDKSWELMMVLSCVVESLELLTERIWALLEWLLMRLLICCSLASWSNTLCNFGNLSNCLTHQLNFYHDSSANHSW